MVPRSSRFFPLQCLVLLGCRTPVAVGGHCVVPSFCLSAGSGLSQSAEAIVCLSQPFAIRAVASARIIVGKSSLCLPALRCGGAAGLLGDWSGSTVSCLEAGHGDLQTHHNMRFQRCTGSRGGKSHVHAPCWGEACSTGFGPPYGRKNSCL